MEVYGNNILTQDACVCWFRRFKSGDFELKDKERPGQPKRFKDVELQALLDEDDSQSQKRLADQLSVSQQAVSDRLCAMGMEQKVGRWVPHELNEH